MRPGIKKPVRRPLVALLFLLLAVTTVDAEDWPQFRGPRRDGVWRETGRLASFPSDGLKIRWRQPVGFGFSSPVICDGRVLVTDAQLENPPARERILCFDEATGKPLWTHSYEVTYPDWAFVPGQGTGPTATPVAADGRLYAVGGNGHVHCLDVRTGGVVWERDLAKEYEVRVLQCRPSPLIDGDRLILSVGARPGACVMALDKRSGREVWKAIDESVSNSSPVIVEAGGERQLIVWTDESVTSLDPVSGKSWWREHMVTSNNDSIPTPVFQENRLLISGLMFELAEDVPSADVLWPGGRPASKRILSNTSTPLLRDGVVYSARSTGELVCLDAATGRQVWETNSVTEIGSGASIHLTPAGEAMYLFTDRGDLISAEVTRDGYREIGRAHLIDPTAPFGRRKFAWAPPAFANGHVFVRNDKELVCASLVER